MAVPKPEKYVADYEKMGYGLFVHWGLYFQLGMGERTYLARIRSKNVTASGNYYGAYAFGNIADEVESVEWMDNGEKLNFSQRGDLLSVDATGFPYGMSCCVRVAKAKKNNKKFPAIAGDIFDIKKTHQPPFGGFPLLS